MAKNVIWPKNFFMKLIYLISRVFFCLEFFEFSALHCGLIIFPLIICSETEKEQVKEIEAAESETQLRAFLKENFDDSQTESTAGSDQFKPFAKDPTKQKRYEQYLVCVKNGRKNALPILQKQFSMTEWEKDRERVEFERASMLFKPLNFSMSSRFVSAGWCNYLVLYFFFVKSKLIMF